MSVFWRSLAVLGGVLLLLLIAVAVAVRSVDVKTFIGPIAQRVKDATGRDLEVRGGIDLKFGLQPSLVLDDVTFGNAPWGKQPKMITAKHVEAQIALLPLLRKRFNVVRFKLIEPTIALETDAAGKGNWEFAAPPAGAPVTTPVSSGGALGGLLVSDFEISNGATTYRDGKTGEITTVLIEDLSVHARDAQSPLSGTFRGKVNDTAVTLEGDFGPLDQVLRQHWPYPLAVRAEIGGKKASVGTQVSVKGNQVDLDELKIGSGSSTLTGRMVVLTGGVRPKVTLTLDAPTLSIADFALLPKPAGAKAAAAHSKYVFSEQPIDVAALKDLDAEGDITIGTLMLAEGRHLDQVHVKLTLANGRLDVPVVQATTMGGTVVGHVQIDASRATDAALTLHAEARNLELGALVAAAGVKRELRGGKTEIKADLTARGVSPRQWASSASGNVLAVAGPATVLNPNGSMEAPLERLMAAVNPFHGVDATTELRCVVVRLPLKDGIASIDRSIAVETSKAGAMASGTIDFRTETLDLSIKPQIRKGVAVAVPQVASLVHFRGPLTSPQVGVDATATAETVAKLGAAIYTGGLSIVGESLFANAAGDAGAPCEIALGRGAAANTASAKPATGTSPAASAAQDVGKAVGHLFGR